MWESRSMTISPFQLMGLSSISSPAISRVSAGGPPSPATACGAHDSSPGERGRAYPGGSQGVKRRHQKCVTLVLFGSGVTPFGAPLLCQTTSLAPSSAYRGVSAIAGDPLSEVCYGPEALHRRPGVLHVE